MRRILSLIAVLALVVAFAMPVMADSHGGGDKAKDKAEKMMKEGKEAGEKAMKKATGNPCNPCNPCAAKAKKKSQ